MTPAEDDPRRCPAISSRTGLRCKNWKIRGAATCRYHGSGTPAARAAAARRVAEDNAREALASAGLGAGHLATTPAAELLRLVEGAAYNVRILEQVVAPLRLESGGYRQAGTVVVETPGGRGAVTLQVAPLLAIYDAERERLAKWSREATRAEADSRPPLHQAQGRVLADVVRAVVAGVLDLVRSEIAAGSLDAERLDALAAGGETLAVARAALAAVRLADDAPVIEARVVDE